MSVNRITPIFVYGMGDNLILLPPQPIIADRDPSNTDLAQLGTLWINKVSATIFGLASVTSGLANWVSTPAAGATVVASLDITGVGGLDVQNAASNTTISSSTIDFDNAAGLTTIAGDVTIGGVTTITGDLDLTSAALIDLTSNLNAAPSIYLHADGGVNEQIRIHSDQGTSVNSVELDSDVGGITLVSGLASNDAINLSATAGGVDIDGALQVNIASSQNAANAIVVNASAGGIDITAAGAATEDIDIVNTAGSINLNSGEVIADSMVLTSAGGLDISVAGTGGLDIDMVNTAGAVNISSAQAAGDAIIIEASDAAGGLQMRAGSAGILIGNEADTAIIDIGDFAPTASRTITIAGGQNVTGGVTDLVEIGPDGVNNATANRTVDINGGNLTDGAMITYIARGNRAGGTHSVNVSTGTGTKTVNLGNADGLTTFNIDAIALINDSLNVNTSINTGTSTGAVAIGNAAAGAISLDSAAGISLDGATASNFTVTGVGADLTLSSVGGSVLIESTEDAPLAIRLHANGGVTETIQLHSDLGTAANSIDLLSDVGGIALTATALAAADAIHINAAAGGVEIDGALQIDIDSAQAAVADAVRIIASAADGGIDIDSGTGGLTIDSTGAVSIQGGAASDVSVGGAGIDLTLASALGRVVVDGGEAAADAVRIVASDGAGGIDIDSGTGGIALDSTAAFSIDGATASNVTVTGASQDLTLSSSGGSVNITATEAVADAIVLNASNAAGGIDLLTGGGEISLSSSGNVSMVPVTATVASPTSTAVTNGRVFKATYTGFTTAAAGTQAYTITNSALGAGDGIMLTLANRGSNDAQITVERVNTETAGTIIVNTTNNGAAALNGDVIITGWILD